jgi:Holliday junction resolvasome RuvABC endonuclease subunit
VSEASSKRNIIVGVDPGTGKQSGAGFAVIDVESNELLSAKSIWCSTGSKAETWRRIQDISLQVGEELKSLNASRLFIESFVMRGKGGETLARFVGAVMPVMPLTMDFKEVSNTRVKMLVSGRGDDDKQAVAEAVHDYFAHSPSSLDLIEELIIEEDFDALDAIAIGIAGVKEYGANS